MLFFNKNKTLNIFLILIIIGTVLGITSPVFAAELTEGMEEVLTTSQLPTTPLVTVIGNIIKWVLGFLGLIATIIIIIGGFQWMSSGGNQEKIDKAKKLMINGLIGLIIVVLAYSISWFIIRAIEKDILTNEEIIGKECDISGTCSGCLRCLNGIWQFDNSCLNCEDVPPPGPSPFYIKNIAPLKGVTVPKNSIVSAIFNKTVNTESVNNTNFIISKVIDENETIVSGSLEQLAEGKKVKFTPEAFCPDNATLHCFDGDSSYKVVISSNVTSENGQNLNCNNGNCSWTFKTNNMVDTQNPEIKSVVFEPSQGKYVPSGNIKIKTTIYDDAGINLVIFKIDLNSDNTWDIEDIQNGTPAAGEYNYEYNWDTSLLEISSQHKIKIEAYDFADNLDEKEKIAFIRAGHCFNGVIDEDEGGVDCGGADCGLCQGAYCDMDENTEGCQADNNICASNVCDETTCICQGLSPCNYDGTKDENEECDGDDLGGKNCVDFDDNYVGGNLLCNSDCTFNFSDCLTEENDPFIGGDCNEDKDCFPENTSPENMIGKTCFENKCVVFPKPTGLAIPASTLTQIKLKWNYNDPSNLATAFEIYERTSKQLNFNLLTTCSLIDNTCSPNPSNNFIFIKQGGDYIFENNGTFIKGDSYTYKVRAKRGTETVYSGFSQETSGVIKGLGACQTNDDCPEKTPCCRIDSNKCVSGWDYCEGNCLKEGHCQIPEKEYVLTSFKTIEGTAMGACLSKVEPNQGKINDSVNLFGQSFGSSAGKINFEDIKSVIQESEGSSWGDKKIESVVPFGLSAGQGKVWVSPLGNNPSNKLPFKINIDIGKPGQNCKLENSSVCAAGADTCQGSFVCLSNNSQEDCRCCCNNDNQCGKLHCIKNIAPCDSPSRGLCCDCTKDSQCGATLGCGFLDENKCCWAKPQIESIKTCSTEDGKVGMNTSIEINFDQLMNYGSLTTDNIKVSRQADACGEGEGIYKDKEKRCYLNGRISLGNEGDKTKVVFYPSNCLLIDGQIYEVEIISSANGKGIISDKGVSFENSNAIPCTWNNDLKCYSVNFQVSTDKTKTCKVAQINVYPRGPVIIKGLNKTLSFAALALDSDGKPVCVDDFTWEATDNTVASVSSPPYGLSTTATSKYYGETFIKASTSEKSCIASPEKDRTCAYLKVSPTGLPQVIENKNCDVCDLKGQSPSPWPDSSDNCLNSRIGVRFNHKMEETTLDSSNVIIEKCNQSKLDDCKNKWENVSWDINNRYIETDDEETLLLIKINLDPSTIYQVILRSGPNGIRDAIFGWPLDGNKNNKKDGSPDDDYVWIFKTGDKQCSLNKVCLTPRKGMIYYPDEPKEISYKTEVYSSNCNYLSADDYSDWVWSLEKKDSWLTPENIAAFKERTPGESLSTAKVVSKGLGEVYVKVEKTEGGQSDRAPLIVATHPVVETFSPADYSQNVCPNTIISATFDQAMETNSLNKETIKLYKGTMASNGGGTLSERESFPFTKQDYKIATVPIIQWDEIIWQEISPKLSSVTKNNKTTIYIKPNESQWGLSLNTFYKVIILGGPTGVKSKYELAMSPGKVWQFKTAEDPCALSKINISVIDGSLSDADYIKVESSKNILFQKPNLSLSLQATAYSEDDQEIEGTENYNWSYTWSFTNAGVISLPDDKDEDGSTQKIMSQNQNGFTEVIAKAEVNNNKEVTVSDYASVENYLCEMPWSFEDTETNFELKYCRGNIGKVLLFNSNQWQRSFQSHSNVSINPIESYTGQNSLLIHQDANEPYPGQCRNDICSGIKNGSWPLSFPYANKCVWKGTEKICDFADDPNCGSCQVSESKDLVWPYTNRTMWARAVYDTTPFNLIPGQDYIFSFYGKGHLAGDISLTLCYNLGWCGQSSSLDYCQKAGRCSQECQYLNKDLETRISHSTDSCCKCRFVQWPYQTSSYPVISLGIIPKGNYQDWALFTYKFKYTEGMTQTLDSQGNLRNEIGLSIGYNNTGENGSDFYIDETMFRLDEYKESVLPGLRRFSPNPSQDSNLRKEWIFSNLENEDIIGLRVYENPDYLTPEEWYKTTVKNIPIQETEGYTSLKIDGYPAIRSGRTVYVGALNVINPGKENQQIESLIYLLSYSDNAKPETLDIYEQLIKNWRFNTNKE
ncbi:MAG: hypothetical protein BWY03_00032 [Parcubacteria group bacterium ADurb.Bin159]|nr:MAG: hypothetical protein BWY03_00032 [Parcubacteria group bacterium ADurb.Bin159]